MSRRDVLFAATGWNAALMTLNFAFGQFLVGGFCMVAAVVLYRWGAAE